MTPLECSQLFHDWAFWARSDQAPPPGDWIIWLILAGRGAGKTRAGAEAVRHWVQIIAPYLLTALGSSMAPGLGLMAIVVPALALAIVEFKGGAPDPEVEANAYAGRGGRGN